MSETDFLQAAQEAARIAGNVLESWAERFTVSDDGNRLAYELTVTDPATFTEPVSGRWTLGWRPDMNVEPYECIAEE